MSGDDIKDKSSSYNAPINNEDYDINHPNRGGNEEGRLEAGVNTTDLKVAVEGLSDDYQNFFLFNSTKPGTQTKGTAPQSAPAPAQDRDRNKDGKQESGWEIVSLKRGVEGLHNDYQNVVLANRQKTYTAQPGDTLASIAEKFGLPVSALAAANGIQVGSGISAGQVLQIPTS